MTVENAQRRHRKLWINQLRTGSYRQGFGVYRRRKTEGDDEYCIIGVGLDIIDNRVWATPKQDRDVSYGGGQVRWGGTVETLADIDGAPGGILSSSPLLAIGKHFGLGERDVDELVRVNDDHSASFDKLADYLEAAPYVNEFQAYYDHLDAHAHAKATE